jgi:predicted ATPase
MLPELDNCERVMEAAADLAVGILRGATNVRILATGNRCATRQSKWHRLSSLAIPATSYGHWRRSPAFSSGGGY